MPPRGRPPGDAGSVGKYLEGEDDVRRFQEVESDDENIGVLLDHGFQRLSYGKQHPHPDELYFNDMDIRAWERRTGDVDGMAYGDDYGYLEDEGYYDDAGDVTMSATEFEELLFQRVLDKIRLARATGDSDVQLSPEELDAYQARIWRSRMPAAHPQARSRPATAPVVDNGVASVAIASLSNTGASGRKKNQRRTSLFSNKPKEKKWSGRSRAPSNVSEMANQQLPPGFVVPGPNGQPMYAPINAYQGRMARDAPARPSGSARSSRSASLSSDKLPPVKGAHATQARGMGFGQRLSMTPARVTPPREMPGTFPGSPISYRGPSPLHSPKRPASSSSRQSAHDLQPPSNSRTRSSPIQTTPKLVPFPTMEYKHHTTEPYQYQVAGQLASSSSSTASQPQYSRRGASGTHDPHLAMPRRVPVPVQRATATKSVHGSYSDSLLAHTQSGLRGALSEEEEEKAHRKASGGGETRRKKGKSRRKN